MNTRSASAGLARAHISKSKPMLPYAIAQTLFHFRGRRREVAI